MAAFGLLLLFVVATVSALPADPVILKYDENRFGYVRGPDGTPHLVDSWMKVSDLSETARYNPLRQNVYHLFTRENPTVSQPLLIGNVGLIGLTNYDPQRRTIVLLHGWLDTATADFNAVLVPAFLEAEDVNIIVVDWSAGSNTAIYISAIGNTVRSGESVADFINWLNSVTGVTPDRYHIVGLGLGGHQAGIIGRNVDGEIAYITALDPASYGWVLNSNKFKPEDGQYTEVIHTNAGVQGYVGTLGDVDFYPNSGVNMPGCITPACDHARSYFYFAESLVSGGFTGRRCATTTAAMGGGVCLARGNLNLGGIEPKTGSSGIYHLRTNSRPPFSRG
ncbi:pancreatic triacylglycerol lipase-like [Galleria mellonella]|uniref:Pancreatic triacylglycerol lipase-like n=1 Tax=Galleria mellonella TaxID=7137 RepID=A0A6J3C7M3_GALME|nr:pancreatic triacylglycerol lipase-like [Galleria mellonella]